MRTVELLYPAEELLRVNVVDTPGLNSLLDEHEETAREFMAQADAVIWLFSAQQAGTQTEQQALALLEQFRLKTVGVINKADQLAGPELAQVERHLRQHFAGLTETLMAISARQALEALTRGDVEALEQSNFGSLRRFLEQQIFGRSRIIKRQACQYRLGELLHQAERGIAAELSRADQARQSLGEQLSQLPERFSPTLIIHERQTLAHATDELYRSAAQEVLDFVRPRRWYFGEHRITAADRDFLLDLLLDNLQLMTKASFERVAQQIEQQALALETPLASLAALFGWESPGRGLSILPLVHERLALLQHQVYARYGAFARGYLLGGRVDLFLSHKLPRLDLTLEPVYQALIADQVDLEQELLGPLTIWHQETTRQLQQHLERQRQEVQLLQLELDQRLFTPILAYQQALKVMNES
jgi:hypothetical protein